MNENYINNKKQLREILLIGRTITVLLFFGGWKQVRSLGSRPTHPLLFRAAHSVAEIHEGRRGLGLRVDEVVWGRAHEVRRESRSAPGHVENESCRLEVVGRVRRDGVLRDDKTNEVSRKKQKYLRLKNLGRVSGVLPLRFGKHRISYNVNCLIYYTQHNIFVGTRHTQHNIPTTTRT